MTQPAQRSFQVGEISPSLYARTDLSWYYTALRTCRNFMVKRGGGATNRAGTEYVGEVKTSALAHRLIPFSYSDLETYVLEFGNGHIRFIKDGAYLPPVGVIAWVGVPHTAGSIVTYLGDTYYAYLDTGVGNPAANPGVWYKLPNPAIFEIPTPYTTAQLPDIQFAQERHIMTLVHNDVPVYELARSGATGWTILPVTFGPNIAAPTGLAIGAGGIAGPQTYWAVTAIEAETFEESLAVLANALNKVPTAGAPVALTWVGGAFDFAYNIYRSTDGVNYGFVASTSTTSYSDAGITPDSLRTFPQARSVFNAANNYPAAVTNYQQRRFFANTETQTETVWGSRIGFRDNFGTSFPLQDDDAVTFTMTGKKANPVKHLLDLGRLIVLTEREEKFVEGDDAGIIRPDAVNPRKISSNGCGRLRPIELDDSALYVQSRGTIVRDLKPVSADAYEGTDLSVRASHLFEGYTIADWDFAENPNSIVWAARSDGVLLGLTYLREHGIWAWHRHDTDGTVENVCVVPEGSNDAVYLIVKRTINGATKRYVERMAVRFVADQEDMIFMDSAKSQDGTNGSGTTITLTTAGGWTETDLLTATSSIALFAAGDVGNVIILRILDADGEETDRIRLRITSFTSTTIVKGFADKTVPAGLRAVAKTTWSLAEKVMTGLGHLEGKALAVLGDGYVVASPNNAAYPTVTVVGGQITLPEPYAKIRAGLPYISDLVTLDLDAPGSQTIKDKKMLINRLGIYLEASRGVWAGMPDQPTEDDPLRGLQEYKARSEEDYGDPITPKTDYVEIGVEARADENARQMIRQVDPLPITVLAIMPLVR